MVWQAVDIIGKTPRCGDRSTNPASRDGPVPLTEAFEVLGLGNIGGRRTVARDATVEREGADAASSVAIHGTPTVIGMLLSCEVREKTYTAPATTITTIPTPTAAAPARANSSATRRWLPLAERR